MKFIKIKGSHFEVGYKLGEWGKVAFKNVICQTSLWETIKLLSCSTQSIIMQNIVKQHYPHYWSELQGMAEGLACDFNDLFAWNCRGDLVPSTSDGCTTIMSRFSDGTIAVAHNEDGFPSVRGMCAIVEIQIDSGEYFISFAYPGSICGHTFAINHHGLVITVNNIRAINRPIGIPRQILARASLAAATTGDAINVLTNSFRSGAFHHTIAKASENKLISVEATADGSSIKNIDKNYHHSNHLIHSQLAKLEQIITASSKSRHEQLTAWIKNINNTEINDKEMILQLSDQKEPLLPIYRLSPADPDDENTIATALFTLKNNLASWAVFTENRQIPILSDKIILQ